MLFSIVVLPINSVINPLLYDTTISKIWEKVSAKTKAAVSHTGLANSYAQKSIFSKTQTSSLHPSIGSKKVTSTAVNVKLRVYRTISKGVKVSTGANNDNRNYLDVSNVSLQMERSELSQASAGDQKMVLVKFLSS